MCNKISNINNFLGLVFFAGMMAFIAKTTYAIPLVDIVSPTNQHRSGYVEISGSGFGSSGTVLIDNRLAITTTWTDTRIFAYIPEASNLGQVDVSVETINGQSNLQTIDVAQRQSTGRVQWRLRMDALYSQVRPAFHIDSEGNGVIYAVDVYQRLYAVKQSGELLWVAQNAGDKGVSVGQDGTIYTGTNLWVKAFNPDGSLKWTFTQDPRAFIFLDVRLGPDGNIYAATSSGMGVFSLDPDGRLRWTTPEAYSRPIVTYSEIQFGPGPDGRQQLYFSANARTRAIRLEDGAEIFTSSTGSLAVSPLDGTLHYPDKALYPDGSLFWQFSEFLNSGPAIAPNGDHFAATGMITPRLFGISPTGNQLWQVILDDSPGNVDVDPIGEKVIVASNHTLNFANTLSSHNARNGARQWRMELPAEEPTVDNSWTGSCGFNQYVDSRSMFSSQGDTLYTMTAIATGNIVADRAFLYAIATDPAIAPLSSQLRSSDVTITAKRKRGSRIITGKVEVEDENQTAINGVSVFVKWDLPDGTTLEQSSLPSSGGKGKKGGGGGSSSAQFTAPDVGPGIYRLTVTDLIKENYSFDPCHGVLSESVYL